MNKQQSLILLSIALIIAPVLAISLGSFNYAFAANPRNNLSKQPLLQEPINYSSINEMENYVFKRTSPQLSVPKRLDRLEMKLFGQNNPKLTAAKRIERLQQTLGGLAQPQPMAQIPNNILPMPMPMPGFGGDPSQLQSQMAQIFQEMNRQMRQQSNGLNPGPGFRAPQATPQPKVMPKEKLPSYNDPNFI